MAAQIAHILAGEEALALAAPELASAYGIGPADEEGPGAEPRKFDAGAPPLPEGAGPGAWFRLGCQGPDIFYHNQRTMPSGLHYGALAHRKNYGLLVEGALALLLEREARLDDAALAWLLGFSTHAALDRATHPFIVCFSGWADPAIPGSQRYRSCHPFLERLLDLGLLAELRGQKGLEFSLAEMLPNHRHLESEGPAIVAALTAGLRLAFPRSAGSDPLIERRAANALADALSFFAITDPARTGGAGPEYFRRLEEGGGARRLALIYPEALPLALDVMNLRREAWPHPAGDGRNSEESFLELYGKGVEAARSALGLVLDCLRGGALPIGIAAAIGNGGLSVTDPAGIPLPPRVSRPLPLAEILESEYERRLASVSKLGS